MGYQNTLKTKVLLEPQGQ